MSSFFLLRATDEKAGDASGMIVNIDHVRAIDEIRPGHCRVVFAPDHTTSLDGPAVGEFLERALRSAAEGGQENSAPYRLQVRQPGQEEWRDAGPVSDAATGVTCAQLIATNRCPGQASPGGKRVRLLDQEGNTIWMYD